MEDVSGEHIGTAELAKLLEESRARTESSVDAQAVHPHFAACPSCRKQFEGLSSLERQLKSMTPSASAIRRDACPRPEVWREIAGGLTPSRETLNLLEHASRCDHCGPLLRAAVGELTALNGMVTEAEQGHLAVLESVRAEWQRSLAHRITATRDQGSMLWWQRWLSFPRLAIAVASFLIVFGMGSWIAVQRNQPAAAQRLLASAYTEKRTLELRIGGANYAPIRISRGAPTSFTSRPEPLLKAESLIATQLQSHPLDPAWLQAKAEADVLEGKYKAAVETLQHALQLDPGSPRLLTDLATAHFERALEEDRQEDFGAAFEYLSQTLKQHPDDPVALFNRAIVSEHQFLYQQALDDWDHYLLIDSTSQWADEARSRANAVREKLKHHQSYATPLLSPAQVAEKLAATATGADLAAEVDPRIEEYLDQAVRSWLPQAFPEPAPNEAKVAADPSAVQALFFLAELTTEHHDDHWLTDFLRGSSASHFRQAANALARAVQANGLGNYNVAAQQATLAGRLFRASGNSAGALRAEFELAYEAQITRHGEDCRRRSTAAELEAHRYSYPWIQIQLGLEKGVCSSLMGDIGAYEKAARNAQDRAQQADYGTLYLRALGFIADGKLDTGERPAVWKLVSAGLDRYWSGQFPAMRGFSLYSFVAVAAEDAGQPNLLVAIAREAAAVIDPDANQLVRARAHSFVAQAAAEAQLPELAKSEYSEASRFYALAPQTDAIRSDRLESQIMTAQLEARQSAVGSALARLTRLQDEVNHLSNDLIAQIFYSVLGEVQLRSQHAPEAERAFRAALRLAEQNLASLTSESSRTTWSQNASPVFLGLAEAELLQGRKQDSLDVFESYLGVPQRAGTRPAARLPSDSPPNPLPARLPLLSHQTVLAYGVLPDGLAIWAYDNRGLRAKWIPQSPQQLQNLLSNFYTECSDPASEPSALRRDSHTLYSLLIAPVEELLEPPGPKRTLVIETEGFLARLPFEALIDASGHYLIERADIVHSPGPYAESHMHPGALISPDLSALVVGSAAASPDIGLFSIPNVLAGVDAVASDFHSPHVLEGRKETLAAVRSALPAAAVFHFAGHAVTTANRTGLMLESGAQQDGAPVLLDADQVRNLKLPNLQLAVLAACSTDSGEGGSRGFDSVASAFQNAGVPHVIASRWAVDSVESDAFMDDFYRFVLSGQTVSTAARLTAQKMLSNPRTSHPFYWSAFAAYGRP